MFGPQNYKTMGDKISSIGLTVLKFFMIRAQNWPNINKIAPFMSHMYNLWGIGALKYISNFVRSLSLVTEEDSQMSRLVVLQNSFRKN